MSPSPNPSADVAAPLSTSALKDRLRAAVRQIPDFPKPGILFEDILPIFSDPVLHQGLITALVSHCNTHFSGSPGSQPRIDAVVALESRGFLFGPSLALQLGVPFIPVRKQGKLPGECVSAEYQKEYGPDIFEMQVDTIRPGWGVIVVDDLIATGGSAQAAGKLVKSLGGNLLGYIFLLELESLNGRTLLDAPVHTLLSSQ